MLGYVRITISGMPEHTRREKLFRVEPPRPGLRAILLGRLCRYVQPIGIGRTGTALPPVNEACAHRGHSRDSRIIF